MKEETKKRWGALAAPVITALLALGMIAGGLVVAAASAILALLNFDDMVTVFGMLIGTLLIGSGGLAVVNLLKEAPRLLR